MELAPYNEGSVLVKSPEVLISIKVTVAMLKDMANTADNTKIASSRVTPCRSFGQNPFLIRQIIFVSGNCGLIIYFLGFPGGEVNLGFYIHYHKRLDLGVPPGYHKRVF